MVIGAIICFAIAVAAFSSWIMMKKYDRGFREDNTETVSGQLTYFTHERNVHIRKGEKKSHKRINCTYTYQVDGIQYNKQCYVVDRIGAMPSSTKVIYQKKKPQNAYLPEFEYRTEQDYTVLLIIAACFCFMGLSLLGQ